MKGLVQTIWIAVTCYSIAGEECYISSQRRFNRMVWTIPRQGLTSCTSLMLGGYKRSRTFSDDVIKVNDAIITTDPAQVQRFLQNNATIGSCPPNMVYHECNCHGTCEDPHSCIYHCELGTLDCFCAKGFLMKGEDCVPLEECGCFFVDFVIPNRKSAVDAGCNSKCWCQLNVLNCITPYQCGAHASCHLDGRTGRCACHEGYYGDGDKCESWPRDCLDWFKLGYQENDVYQILPVGWTESPFSVFCDMISGGWTVIQKRSSPAVDFNRGWSDYKSGFGDRRGDFWVGNDPLHYITNQRTYTLLVEVTNTARNRSQSYTIGGSFVVGPEKTKYSLGRGFDGSEGTAFSTHDSDNDACPFHCAKLHQGGWWYGDLCSQCSSDFDKEICSYVRKDDDESCYVTCTNHNLNGVFGTSLFWNQSICDIDMVEMKLLPVL